MKWMKEKRKNKSIYNMTKLELIANSKEKQKIINKAIKCIKENEYQYMNEYALERFRNNLLQILDGDKEDE